MLELDIEMHEEEPRLSIEDILASDLVNRDQIVNPLAAYPEVTTRALSILSLKDCKELRRSSS